MIDTVLGSEIMDKQLIPVFSFSWPCWWNKKPATKETTSKRREIFHIDMFMLCVEQGRIDSKFFWNVFVNCTWFDTFTPPDKLFILPVGFSTRNHQRFDLSFFSVWPPSSFMIHHRSPISILKLKHSNSSFKTSTSTSLHSVVVLDRSILSKIKSSVLIASCSWVNLSSSINSAVFWIRISNEDSRTDIRPSITVTFWVTASRERDFFFWVFFFITRKNENEDC